MMLKKAGVILRDAIRQTDRSYTYGIPDELEGKIRKGSYVTVPFGRGNKPMTGIVTDIVCEETDENELKKLKYISDLKYPYPVLTEEQMDLIGPLCSRYLCTAGEAICLMVPSQVGKVRLPYARVISLKDRRLAEEILKEGKLRSINQIRMLEYLLERGDTEQVTLLSSTDSTAAQLRALIDKELVMRNEILLDEDDEEDETDGTDKAEPAYRIGDELVLNDEQKAAYEAVLSAGDKKASVFLLHGITGSGKTEVYLKCAGDIIRSGGTVIFMVPEISLTPQTSDRIIRRFGDLAAVFHSRLTDRQRLECWEKIRCGRARIVVGPRSCIFAPVKDLKLIIIDEEHDSSYKSEMFPRYNTKDIATLRAKYNDAKIILGSATPSVSSYYAAKKGYYRLLKLKKRAVPDSVLPEVIPVDMKTQIKEGAGDILSLPLRGAMARALSDGKQVMLFLNRRGYSRTLVCSNCKEPVTCPNCSVGMTLHVNRRSPDKLLICHYCGFAIPSSEAVCGFCGAQSFVRAGIGTQKLEEMLSKAFPHEKILRMDQDTTLKAGSHEELLGKFRSHEASILIGTQMIAKGHDFPDVTVVGIIGADSISSSADYKASERTFQLITQASGRAGRSGTKGEVYLQSMRPSDPLLIYAASQNYEAFYDEEIRYREAMKLPPFKAIGEIVLSLPDEELLNQRISDLDRYLRDFLSVQDKKYGFELMGPVPSPIYELRGRYRMMFVIKAVNRSSMNAVFRQIMNDFDHEIYPISFDSDAGGI